jgi:hypothetical protein
MPYAVDTKVPVERTLAEIKTVLAKRKANRIFVAEEPELATLVVEISAWYPYRKRRKGRIPALPRALGNGRSRR